jgi:hypothetical protein
MQKSSCLTPLADHPEMDELAQIVTNLPEHRKSALFDAIYDDHTTVAYSSDHALEDIGEPHEDERRDG